MKSSTLTLSFLGFCLFYICNADWMDRLYETLVEEYLGPDHEEVAPFVSSVSTGAEEFDQIIEEMAKSKRKWYHSLIFLPYAGLVLTLAILLYQVLVLSKERVFFEASRRFLGHFCQSFCSLKKTCDEIQNLSKEFPEGKKTTKEVAVSAAAADDVPVKLLWKGGSLIESSIHCNVRDDSIESKILHMQKQLLQSKLLVKCSDMGGGDETAINSQLSPISSDESTAIRMTEIRKLLESEPEIIKAFADVEESGERSRRMKTSAPVSSCRRMACKKAQKSAPNDEIAEEDGFDEVGRETNSIVKSVNHSFSGEKSTAIERETRRKSSLDWEGTPDPKIMNRIRLLESRLRLEELKNKNWINRMSRAEGILQQLNKQVERIEETRPVETRTETLKITSTVTNWASSAHPRRNTQFTLVNQCQPFYLDPPCLSLSEVIKKEIGLPSAGERNEPLYPLSPTPQIPALSSNSARPQSSFLSKFLSR